MLNNCNCNCRLVMRWGVYAISKVTEHVYPFLFSAQIVRISLFCIEFLFLARFTLCLTLFKNSCSMRQHLHIFCVFLHVPATSALTNSHKTGRKIVYFILSVLAASLYTAYKRNYDFRRSGE